MSAEQHALVGAYALDALDHREQLAFEAHLASCPTCSDELAGFVATAERLGGAVATAPPPELRDRVLTTAARTAQERRVVPLSRAARWRQRAPQLVAAASILAVLGAVGAYVGERDRVNEIQQADAREAAVLASDDATSSRVQAGETTVTVWSSRSLDSAVVVMSDVPPLEPKRSYQMWVVDAGGEPRSVAVMGPDDVDHTSSTLVDDIDDAAAVAVTVEPEGGSKEPTTDPVLSVDLA